MHPSRSHSGFTLIELVIVIAIVGILTAIAVPAYRDQVMKTRRATAAGDLQSLAQALERFNTLNATYVGANCATLAPTNDFYAYSCTEQTRTRFAARAVPAGDQTNDRCGTLTLDSAGVRGVTGGTVTDATLCW